MIQATNSSASLLQTSSSCLPAGNYCHQHRSETTQHYADRMSGYEKGRRIEDKKKGVRKNEENTKVGKRKNGKKK